MFSQNVQTIGTLLLEDLLGYQIIKCFVIFSIVVFRGVTSFPWALVQGSRMGLCLS